MMTKDFKDEKRNHITSCDLDVNDVMINSLFRQFSTKIVDDFEMKNQNVINCHEITKTTRTAILITNREE